MKLESITSLARDAGDNDAGKLIYRKVAMSYLRKVAKDLCLTKGEYQIRFNAGGVAVSGDAILHADKFYLIINEFGVMWRTCQGQKDYTGGPNRWVIGFRTNEEESLIEDIVQATFSAI